MLKIHVLENGECLLEKRVPDEFGTIGCVFLLQETFIATLALGGSVECGDYTVKMVDTGAPSLDGSFDINGDSEATRLTNADTLDGESLTRVLDDALDSDPDLELTQVGEGQTLECPISLEIYARIPGYDFRALLGRGGMGMVWKAVQLSTNRFVAVKTIHPRMLSDPKSQKRFQREVELAARLTHPNIVRVYEAGQVSRQSYFSMELVDGVPWSHHVRSNHLSKSDVLKQLLQVLDAVSYAHSQGVVHRDLKPSNILVDKSGKVYVVDFGLAKYQSSVGEELSRQGDVIGTLTFMSPEQASGDVSATDSRSDVYSLGAVVVYLLGNGLSSETAAPGDSTDRSSADRDLQRQAAGILRNDPRLRRILVKALAPKPAQRYDNAGDFAADLRDYLEVRLTEVSQGIVTPKRQTPGWMLATACALFLMVAGTAAGLLYWRTQGQETAETSPSPAEVDGSSLAGQDAGEDPDAATQEVRDFFTVSFQSSGELPPNCRTTLGIGKKDPAEHVIVHPEGWPLIGFNLATYTYKDRLIIKTIQPVFRDPETGQTETSEMVGRLHSACHFHQVVAKSGFRVVGIDGVGGRRLHALKLKFEPDRETAPTDSPTETSYESTWFGDPMNGPVESVGETASDAVGVICSYSADVHQVGLILADPTDPD